MITPQILEFFPGMWLHRDILTTPAAIARVMGQALQAMRTDGLEAHWVYDLRHHDGAYKTYKQFCAYHRIETLH